MRIDKKIMDMDFIKIYGANTFAYLSTFTTIDSLLKLTLLVASISYTIIKIVLLIKKGKNDKED